MSYHVRFKYRSMVLNEAIESILSTETTSEMLEEVPWIKNCVRSLLQDHRVLMASVIPPTSIRNLNGVPYTDFIKGNLRGTMAKEDRCQAYLDYYLHILSRLYICKVRGAEPEADVDEILHALSHSLCVWGFPWSLTGDKFIPAFEVDFEPGTKVGTKCVDVGISILSKNSGKTYYFGLNSPHNLTYVRGNAEVFASMEMAILAYRVIEAKVDKESPIDCISQHVHATVISHDKQVKEAREWLARYRTSKKGGASK